MKLLKKRFCLVSFLVIVLLLFPYQIFAEGIQPAVAVKKPRIGEGLSNGQIKNLNLTMLWAEMENSLRDTRKFRVLSRNKSVLQEISEEQEFAASDFAKGDAAATGQLNNANYLILSTVQDFKFYRKHTPVPNFDDKYKRIDAGLLQVSAQMYDTTSGELMTTFSLKASFKTAPEVVNGRVGSPSSVKFTGMAKRVAGQLADQFVAALYPMKVVKRGSKGRVFLNRGKDGGLNKGQILEVFSVGEALIDPDTGKSLGSTEEYIGKIKVVRINPKVTIAVIVSEEDAEFFPIEAGNIARLPQ